MKTMDQIEIIAQLRIDHAAVTAGWSGHDATGRYVVTASKLEKTTYLTANCPLKAEASDAVSDCVQTRRHQSQKPRRTPMRLSRGVTA